MAQTDAIEPIILDSAAAGSDSVEIVSVENGGADNNEQSEEAVEAKKSDDFLGEDDSDEDDFVVTIGEIKSNVSFQKGAPAAGGGGGGVAALAGGRPELDGLPSHKGVPIYDLDLATMEDKPWRKPGADLTDYFNYGFNEDTWNQYCERQKKLRSEYGSNQEHINRAIFNSISLPMGGGGNLQQFTAMSGGRQLVNIMAGAEKPKMNKVVIDLSKPPPIMEQSQSTIIRTIITGSGSMSQNLSSMSEMQSSTTQSIVNSALITLGGDAKSSSISTITSSGSSNLVSLTGRGAGAPPPVDFSIPPPSAGGGPPTDFSQPPPSASVADFSMPPPNAAPASDFSKPPPSMALMSGGTGHAGGGSAIQSIAPTPTSLPPPNTSQPPPLTLPPIVKSECPPGVDEPDIPGVSTPPPGISSFGSINPSASQLGFNPAIPPPGGHLPGMNIPPPSLFPQQPTYMPPGSAVAGGGAVLYSARPQPLFPPRGSAGYGGGGPMPPGTEGGRGGGGGRDYRDRERDYNREYSSGDSADEAYRRKRRRRSRSVSVDRTSRRRKEEKDRDTHTSTSRRHDSPHESSATTSSRTASKRKSERTDREKERSSGGDTNSKRRGGSTRSGAEKEAEREKDSTDERSDRKRKKHDKSEKERDREKS